MIELEGLTRRFGDFTAVDDLSLTVPEGTLVGFVGANGAGKTTTMRMTMGVLAAHAGQVRWQGRPITAADRRRFGYMPEERGLYPKQKVSDQLIYLARLHGMPVGAARRAVTEHLDRFGLADRAKDHVEKLSLGNQQRVQIIAAMLADPIALILDEPFSGLDPIAVDAMVGLLREHTKRGVPVLFSSHQLDLVERLCDQVVVLSHGRVVASGVVADLRAQATTRHRLVVDHDAGWIRDVPGIAVEDVDGPRALLQIQGSGAEHALLSEALRRGTIIEFGAVVPTLSEIYREVTA
ncbi:Multidrug efflux system ATP-binding protein [Austwickia sp. TVS 96-490-7B]|uniref:ABC transporter ATP-binding protein n=1 Tax=Austwickia sp. TVS 96-490-7B TaxID=2830843 RepID=UPI001C5626BB|nr:ATP-binding cassette domain-containing protein [Austwickia sp. TVS 96-490-7B]MBW3084036.1 Multidrug efflux system ATP-binding protein [Austwickia sp. TVS 96-490-7B]